MTDLLSLLSVTVEGPLSTSDSLLVLRYRDALRESHDAMQAMRICIVYARDRRGHQFDFDTWIRLVESALEKGQLPKHAIEEAQGEALAFRQALTNVQRERDALQREVETLRRERSAYVASTVETKREGL